MKSYTKPLITSNKISGLILIMAPVFISPIAPVAAGAAAVAAILSKKGNSIIDSTHTEALTARKNFSLT
ncbi:MAG: hypothetical protein IKD80_07265 [Selenomonadaceae bacterium]|nr:hypothetical protein [Selenomonadaceae bacterium]